MKDDSDSEDDTKELKRQLNKTNSNFKVMREIFNQNAAALSELQEQARKNQDLEKEVATLRAAANKFNSQQNDNRPCNNWNNTRQSTTYR
ncbi:hypothetical protein CGCA056_v009948 [Colletotrichum aenigma]|uniref:uncharacterized protein n=1 Tax=Colletotrichum aenigma TaxID=1215731 RepID=UPI0018722353|nr:uncharacterized protein CGCA056_v009948 [Colletotrichum aenigma]KAF5519283.1 hypothetical protein CGCA056_v009948 [Colletotrichum aenigma]